MKNLLQTHNIKKKVCLNYTQHILMSIYSLYLKRIKTDLGQSKSG